MSKNPWIIERLAPEVFRLTFLNICSGWEGRILLQSDEHHDNAHSDLSLIKRHNQEACDTSSPIFKFGDTFCAMQGKWDKRADQNELRSQLRGNNYLDRLVDYAEDLYAPYAKNIALISKGNHESSIEKHHQTNLVERLCDRLKIMNAGYWGFVIIRFQRGKTCYSRTLYFHHGYGGGGPVTRGLIDNSRTRDSVAADIFYSGHIHRQNADTNIILDCSAYGKISRKVQLFLRGGSYKDDLKSQFHIEKGGGPRPMGGWWVNFKYFHRGRPAEDEFKMSPVPAD